MGLFSFFKDEFIEVIEWQESQSDVMMWKFPDRDAEIKYGAQLTVRESQEALMVDEGTFADQFEPGRFELITNNVPVLTTLRNWDMGFKSPFKVDVYFFSKRTFTNLKWGTANPVILKDPEFKQVRVKAFGVYFIKLMDARKFFTEFAGTKAVVRSGDIEDALRPIISPKFAEALAEAEIPVMDLVSNYSELGEKIHPILKRELANFGLELVKFQVTSTSLPKEVEEFYDKMTNMNMVDDMDKFKDFQTSQAIEKAAENEGGGASEGIGMGMGFGMANMLNQKGGGESSGASKEDILQMIKELGKLKTDGILTEEEFESKKKELLSRL